MAVQMQKILQQRGWVQKTGKNMQKIKSRVCDEIGRADREFEGNRRGQVATFWPTEAVEPWEIGQTDAAGSQLKG